MQAPNHYLYAAAEVLNAYAEATAAPLLAVSGNVDDVPGTAQLLPPHRVLEVAGWKLLLVHIVAPSLQSKGAQLAHTAMVYTDCSVFSPCCIVLQCSFPRRSPTRIGSATTRGHTVHALTGGAFKTGDNASATS